MDPTMEALRGLESLPFREDLKHYGAQLLSLRAEETETQQRKGLLQEQ